MVYTEATYTLDMSSDSQMDNSPTIGATDDYSNDDSCSTVSDDESWRNFTVTRSTNADNNEHDFELLLKTPRDGYFGNPLKITSILGDTWINYKREYTYKYYLNRAILASKSKYLTRLAEDNDGEDISNAIVETIQEDDVYSPIIQIMYGKDLKRLIEKHNFVDLFKNMCCLEMETDLDVFKEFIEKTIKSKEEICHEMIELYFFMLSSRLFDESKCDYLLPTVSQYFSDRLLDAYKMKKFSSMPYEGLLRILLHRKTDELQDKCLIGRICAGWICHDFETRVVKLIKLVNATKHRYGIFHYCNTDEEQSIIDSAKQIGDKSRVQQVEKLFNKLLHYHGDVLFDSSQLSDVISDESPIRIINAIDQPSTWTMFLEKEYFCDVVIVIKGLSFKLHRIKLLLSSRFFYDLFTKNKKPSSSTNDEKSAKLTTETHTIDEIDATAFEQVISYIYEGKIDEIGSEYSMINLLKTSKFLQIDDLYEECYVWFLNSLCKITGDVIFDLFHFLYENERTSDLYTLLVHRILGMFPEFVDCNFNNISLEILEEIVALPELEMNSADEVVDLCSKWIFHDMEQRYSQVYEIAAAINRNFAFDVKRPKLEKPDSENSVEHSLKYVKEFLIKCLSSSTLVPLNSGPCLKNDQMPCFIGLQTDGALSIVDKDFNEIVSINSTTLPVYSGQAAISISHYSATVIDDKLFVLFNVNEKFHFYAYIPTSRKFISLATDPRMHSFSSYTILNCNDEVYYVGDTILLKYCFHLNRWITFVKSKSSRKWFTSDGKMLYKISFRRSPTVNHSGELITSFFDFKQTTWNRLPDIPVQPSLKIGERIEWSDFPIAASSIGNDLCVLFKWETLFFHWKVQTWSMIENSYEGLVSLAECDRDILFISAKNKILRYSPFNRTWVLVRTLDNFSSIFAVHKTMK
ncbi:uncharacterized protein LOC135842474 [Planococcus citri]|uniref:uncharacterized protein LOC135842474 n=1 Tax=Planococcus citri TaxID=170843 RepID=UPI0031FA2E7A